MLIFKTPALKAGVLLLPEFLSPFGGKSRGKEGVLSHLPTSVGIHAEQTIDYHLNLNYTSTLNLSLANGMYIFVIQNGDKVVGRQRVVISR
jgi:hypothetical protein